MTTQHPCYYEIWIDGQLPDTWSDWFGGLDLQAGPDGATVLRGLLADQAALLGVLNRMNALNLALVSVKRLSLGQSGGQTPHEVPAPVS